MVIILFLIALVFFAIWLWKHRSNINMSDTVIAYTGGLGAGKTAIGVKTVIKIYNKNVRYCKLHKMDPPILFSNIPILIDKRKNIWSAQLTNDITLLRKSIPQKSVVFIDEVGSYASQFDYRAKNMDVFDEFVRFFRHYTHGGALVVTDQCSENICLQIRRRINTVHNLAGYKKMLFLPFMIVRTRPINISEEIKTIAQVNEDDPEGFKTIWFFGNSHKHYDSYCYDARYTQEAALPQFSTQKKQIELFKLEK